MNRLTFIADLEAFAGAAVVGGEEQVHVIAGADEKVWRLGAVVLADERRRVGGPVPNLQRVVINLRLKPARKSERVEHLLMTEVFSRITLMREIKWRG